jgi:hypothetical protein
MEFWQAQDFSNGFKSSSTGTAANRANSGHHDGICQVATIAMLADQAREAVRSQ